MIAVPPKIGSPVDTHKRLYRVASTVLVSLGVLCLSGGCSPDRMAGPIVSPATPPMAIAHSHISINSPDLPHTADHHSGVPPLVGQLPVVATSRDLRAETARRSSGEDDPNPVATGQGGNSESMKRELAVAVLDDSQLGQVRGGIDSGSGVELNFAFQQSTVINNDVVQNVILPTITVAGNGTDRISRWVYYFGRQPARGVGLQRAILSRNWQDCACGHRYLSDHARHDRQ